MTQAIRIFLISWVSLAIIAYVVILGDAGIIQQQRLQEELQEVQSTIEDLKRENAVLNESYFIERQRKEKAESGSTIVLKFNQDNLKRKRSVSVRGIAEYRILYWFGVVFVGLIGLTFLLTFEKDRVDLPLSKRILTIIKRRKIYE